MVHGIFSAKGNYNLKGKVQSKYMYFHLMCLIIAVCVCRVLETFSSPARSGGAEKP